MLTTYLFRFTSECTIPWSNFQNFIRLRRQAGIDPASQNPADVPDSVVTFTQTVGRTLRTADVIGESDLQLCWRSRFLFEYFFHFRLCRLLSRLLWLCFLP